jgi:hypothetical protein
MRVRAIARRSHGMADMFVENLGAPFVVGERVITASENNL